MRAYKKGLYSLDNSNDKFIKNRNLHITKSMVGNSYYVYNGKQFILIKVKSGMVGQKIGSFSFTRKIYQYKKGKKKK